MRPVPAVGANLSRVLLCLIALCFIVLWCSGCGQDPWPETIEEGTVVPEFSLPGLDGGEVTFQSAIGDGRATLINFWATWCQPCLREIPELVEMTQDARLRIVGIALDEGGAEAVSPFVEQHGIDYPVLLGDQAFFQRMGGYTIPYTLMLDTHGRVVDLYRGPVKRADIEADLASLEDTP